MNFLHRYFACHPERTVTESKDPAASPTIIAGYSTGSFDFAQDDNSFFPHTLTATHTTQ